MIIVKKLGSAMQNRASSNSTAKRLVLTVAICTSMLTACERSMNFSDQELLEKINECNAIENKAPGMAVACGNYQKECQRRGKKTGNYFC